jgi:putative ABC transport system permease protein
MLWATVVMALREIRRNALRSTLTMLGVVIGVGSVIALVSLGRGATEQVTSNISKLGKNLLTLTPGANLRGGLSAPAPPLTVDDSVAIKREVIGIDRVAAAGTTQEQVIFGNSNARTSITGSSNEFFAIRGYVLDGGRFFSDAELQSGQAVCVIGQTVRKALFALSDPLGNSIRVGRIACQVVGLLQTKGQAGMGQDQDDIVVLPLRAFQRRIAGNLDVNMIFASAQDGRPTQVVADSIRSLMRQRRNRADGAPDDFRVRDMAEIAQAASSSTAALTVLLGSIAAVSLLVGGIGIMNIMLVSVTERTREIGIRLAIGAFAGEIMMQFLLEATVLSTFGGLLGVGLGILGSYFTCRAMDVPFLLAPDVMIVAFVFSSLVGMLFGYLPARKAAQLNPIEALRHE